MYSESRLEFASPADDISSHQEAINYPPLAIVTSIYGSRDGSKLILDNKAVEGFKLYAEYWPGEVIWLLVLRDEPPSYSSSYDAENLPFKVVEVNADCSDVIQKIPKDSLLIAGADNFNCFFLASVIPERLVYIIEYTIRTRFDILRSSTKPFLKKLRSAVWEILTEIKRRRAIAAASGLQCNGLPSYQLYGPRSRNAMQYFDTRLSKSWCIENTALLAKQNRMRNGAPLHLAFSGRLNRMKGAHYLPSLINYLEAAGLDFVFEIFGEGELSEELQVKAKSSKVILHGPQTFPDEWVPAMKERIDLFICPHPQGDPSCTYMETLGCGVPIVGFANEAWRLMAAGHNFGYAVPVGSVKALAKVILQLNKNRNLLAEMATAAAAFGSSHSTEVAFLKRVEHLKEIQRARFAAAIPRVENVMSNDEYKSHDSKSQAISV